MTATGSGRTESAKHDGQAGHGDGTAGSAQPDPAHRASPGQPERKHRPVWMRRVAGWAPLLIPGIVLLLADGYGLGRLSLWRDEAYTVDAASRPLSRILATAGHIDATISTYYAFMHAWIAVAGISETALRLPSLLAMAMAAVFTAAIGRRLARAARLPAPALTGALAGLLFVAAPQITWYAQDARSYGLVTMCATIATYLLLRALADGAVALVGGLRDGDHGDRAVQPAGYPAGGSARGDRMDRADQAAARPRPGGDCWAIRPAPVSRWLTVAGAAVVVLSPLLVTGFGQRRQISWLARPGVGAVSHLVVWFAGSQPLVPLLVLLVLVGVIASVADRPRAAVDMVTVAVPWLVLPAVILLAASQIHPVYDARYVVFCLPALALLGATGLAWVTRLAMLIPLRKAGGAAAWLPAALIVVLLAALVLGPQRSVRLASSRPDNPRMAAAILADHARRGDAVLYLPSIWRVYSMAYPAPYRRLRDVALAKAPVAAANLVGTAVRAATLRARFATVSRVWVFSWRGMHVFRKPRGLAKTEVALLQPFRLVRRWSVGQAVLSLYQRG